MSRRAVLKTTGLALAGGVLATGTAVAHGGDITATGHTVSIGDGTATSYTERARGRLSAVGVRFDATALAGLPAETMAYHLDLPRGDTGRFEYAGVDWNPGGHDPLPLYGHPHFDFHFYLLDEASVAAIPPGAATYDIPSALMPANTITTADLPPAMGGPQPRFVVPSMGEHLVSVPASLPSTPGSDGWSVYIWGAHDPDGDGVGQMTFMEPMVTLAYLESLKGDGTADSEVVTPIPMPNRFVKGGWYPTEFVVRYHSHDDSFSVSLESFAQFAGYGHRH